MDFDLSKQIKDAYEANERTQRKIKAILEERTKELTAISIRHFKVLLNMALSEEFQKELALEIKCSDYHFGCTAHGDFNGLKYSFQIANIDGNDDSNPQGWEIKYPRKRNWDRSMDCQFDNLEQELIVIFGKLQNIPAIPSSAAEDCDDNDDECSCGDDCDCGCEYEM